MAQRREQEDPKNAPPPEPPPPQAAATDMPMPEPVPAAEEPIVDTTHWPAPLRHLVDHSDCVGQHITHEKKDYEIVGVAGSDGLLVMDAGEGDLKPVYYKRLPHDDEGHESNA
jgi:hypothetical protein